MNNNEIGELINFAEDKLTRNDYSLNKQLYKIALATLNDYKSGVMQCTSEKIYKGDGNYDENIGVLQSQVTKLLGE